MIDDEFTKTFLEKRLSFEEGKFDCLTMDCPSDKLSNWFALFVMRRTFDLLVDLTAIDHGEEAQVRFSVVLHFYSLVDVVFAFSASRPDNENPSVPSIAEVYPAANWHERETYDMFGINFEGILISGAS